MREPAGTPFSRRRVLQLGAAAALVACGMAAAIVRTRGYAIAPGRRLDALRPWQFVVLQHVARRIAAPDRPSGVVGVDEVDVVGFADAWVSRMGGRARRDLGRLLAYLEHVAPLVAGFVSRFTRLDSSAQDAVLASLERSSNDLLRAGFEGVKALVFLGYYRDARTWTMLGYDGPLVRRPAGGWQ